MLHLSARPLRAAGSGSGSGSGAGSGSGGAGSAAAAPASGLPPRAKRPRTQRSKAAAAAAADFDPDDEEKTSASAGSAAAASKMDIDEPSLDYVLLRCRLCKKRRKAEKVPSTIDQRARAKLSCDDLWYTECGQACDWCGQEGKKQCDMLCHSQG
jgi:hypothetical protein